MNDDDANKGVLAVSLPSATEEWLKQVHRQLQANFASLEAMPKRYTRETGMEDPDLDLSTIPYEPK